jgi:hypothetical protein
MGRNIFHAGPVGTGHAIKLVNNMCSGGILALTIEAVAVAARAGVDPARAVEILRPRAGAPTRATTSSRASSSTTPSTRAAIRLMMKDLDGYGVSGGGGCVAGRARPPPGLPARDGPAAWRTDHTAIARIIEVGGCLAPIPGGTT